MALRSSLLALLAVLVGVANAARVSAQALSAAAAPPAPAAAAPAESEVLPGLPRPLEVPRSLYQQPSPVPPFSCAPLPGPYFERDPLLDPPWMPQPGWFADVELGIIVPHVKNRLVDTVTVPGMTPDTLHLPSAELNWTVAPRFELGYRLPSGFGEFALAYRFFTTEGSQLSAGPDGIAALKSRLAVNMGDLDYANSEFPTLQWPHFNLKWRFGLRAVGTYFDSRSDEPFADAAAGSGVFERRTTNNFWGFGPHLGLQLTRWFEDSGFSFIGSVDGATILGRLRQNFFEESTTFGPNGQPLAGNTRQSVSQDVPMIDTFVGFGWTPPSYTYFRLSVGYEYEYWWNIGRNSSTLSRGELSDQGIVLRAEFNF
jgi:hypothetical protein